MFLRDDLKDLPPYIPGKLRAGAIKMASNENPLGPSPLALQALSAHLAGLHVYPDGASSLLTAAISEKLGVKPEQLLVGNGSDEVLTLIAGAFITPGLNGVTALETFSEYNFAVRLFGGSMKFAPLKDGTYDLDALAALVDDQTRLVFLCNPNNPTGTAFGQAALERFLDKLPPTALVVLDEAYCHFAEAADYPRGLDLLQRYPRLIVLRTFSKLYGLAALRVGFAVAAPELIRQILVVKQPFNVGTLGQVGAAAALKDTEFEERSLKLNRSGRLQLEAGLTKLGLHWLPTQANFIAVHLGRPAKPVFERMAELGITIRPLGSFQLPDWIRITIGLPEHNDKCLAVLAQALKDVPV